MKLNRYEKKILQAIVDNRKGTYETPKRERNNYKPCKEYDAALSLFMKKLIYAEAANELLMEGPSTPEPKYRWPIFLILFIGLGLAAGIRTMMRTAEEVQKMHMAQASEEES